MIETRVLDITTPEEMFHEISRLDYDNDIDLHVADRWSDLEFTNWLRDVAKAAFFLKQVPRSRIGFDPYVTARLGATTKTLLESSDFILSASQVIMIMGDDFIRLKWESVTEEMPYHTSPWHVVISNLFGSQRTWILNQGGVEEDFLRLEGYLETGYFYTYRKRGA